MHPVALGNCTPLPHSPNQKTSGTLQTNNINSSVSFCESKLPLQMQSHLPYLLHTVATSGSFHSPILFKTTSKYLITA